MVKVNYSFFIDKKYEKTTKDRCERKYFVDKELQVEVLENAVVLPGDNLARGGCLYNGEVLPQSSYHRGAVGLYEFNENEVIDSEEEVVYVGMWPAVWGHCLTDNVKHLWFLFQSEYDYLKNYKWVYSPIWGVFDESHNFWQLLRKWNVNIENINRVEKPTRYRRVFLPDDAFIDSDKGKLYTKGFTKLFSNTTIPTPNLEIPVFDKLYFTRTAWGGGKDFGEKSIENAFRKMGYQVMSPEMLGLDELIFVLRHCNVLATTEGSISHNSLFMNEGSRLVLIRKAYYINGYQFPINEMKSLKVTIIDSHKSISVNKNAPWLGPFFLYCGRNLKRFAPDVKCEGFPLKEFLVYLIKTKYFRKLLKKALFIR